MGGRVFLSYQALGFERMVMSVFFLLKQFIRERKGVTAIEYGILAAGIAIIIGVLVSDGGSFSKALDEVFNNIIDQLPSATNAKAGK